MGKLICIIGNNGSGKTTLTKALCKAGGFAPYLESHEDRPYQFLFAQDVRRYALPNQLDYLLTRVEQEYTIRTQPTAGVQDGGLDQDFHLYTRLFHQKGFLDDKGYALCQRTYQALRNGAPLPDLFVRLKLPLTQLRQRLQARARFDLEQLVTLDDLNRLEYYLEEWTSTLPPERLLVLDIAHEGVDFAGALSQILAKANLPGGLS